MAHVKHTTLPRKFNHLTLVQRGMITAYHDKGLSTRQIGAKLGCDHSTISRELRRGCVLQRNSDLTERYGYYPDVGQRVYNENRLHYGTWFKLAEVSGFLDHAGKMLRDKKWSQTSLWVNIEPIPRPPGCLLSAQRHCIITLTKAYSTKYTASPLQVGVVHSLLQFGAIKKSR